MIVIGETGNDEDRAGHLRHAGQQLEQPAAGHGRRARQEHLRPHGRERRRQTHRRRISQGLSPRRRALQNVIPRILKKKSIFINLKKLIQ